MWIQGLQFVKVQGKHFSLHLQLMVLFYNQLHGKLCFGRFVHFFLIFYQVISLAFFLFEFYVRERHWFYAFFLFFQVLFPLLDRVRSLFGTASTDKITDMGGNILIHHSRNTAQKQLAETQVKLSKAHFYTAVHSFSCSFLALTVFRRTQLFYN